MFFYQFPVQHAWFILLFPPELHINNVLSMQRSPNCFKGSIGFATNIKQNVFKNPK